MTSFDPATHTYTVDGVVVPSVTQILKLTGFAPDFSRVEPDVVLRKAALGTLVHEACVVLDEGDDLDWSALGSAEPYVRAYRRFRIDSGFKADLIECHHLATVNGASYGMTPDRTGWISREPTLLDIKTPANEQRDYWSLQLAGYALGLPRPVTPPFEWRRAAVQLRSNATYRLLGYNDPGDLEDFKSALRLAYRKLRGVP